jgi:mono/diheme cytochrome c family protein
MIGRPGRRLAVSPPAWLALAIVPFMIGAGPFNDRDKDKDAGKPRTGEQIYRQMCASCHGASGEGTDDHYPRPLIGERSVPKLANYIAQTMPEDDPGTCVGPDADKVASYMYDAFYSKAAQARNPMRPARIELSRLTVRQYRNAVADLVGSFRWTPQWGDQRGLKAEYSAGRRGRRGGGNNNGAAGGGDFQRVDPEVRFHFGGDSPIAAQNAVKEQARHYIPLPALPVPVNLFRQFSQEFRVTWTGAVLAPETGEYEFVVRSENALRLFVNDPNKPLIDISVKSGNDSEYREAIHLLGGRVYPIRLELTRGKDEKTSSMELLWKVPRRALAVIPARNLSPADAPPVFAVQTPFPPDDRSVGYERGTSISKAWDQATTDAAIETADYVAGHLKDLAGVGDEPWDKDKDKNADREKKLREFCAQFAERAFRRPLADEHRALYIDRQFQDGRDPRTIVKKVVLLVLKSPRFLYREIGSGAPDAFDVASRLSFGLWDTIPDRPLWDAASSGRLADRKQVAEQARRMAADLRTRAKLREFLLQWLRVDQGAEIAKDPKIYPGFDEAVISDLRNSLEMFLDDIITSPSADFRELLGAKSLYLNGRLARLYGADLPPDAPFTKVDRAPGDRSGILTHPYLMSNFAYTASSSPIHRGVFLSRSVLGRPLRPPPEAVAPLAADLHPDLTTRQRVELQTKPESCQSCHAMINHLGFALEHYDAIGRYRDKEKGRSVDAAGSYETRTGDPVKFDGAAALAAFLAASQETHNAFVQQLFHYLVKQPIRAFSRSELTDLRGAFARNGYNIRELMVEIMTSSALASRGNHVVVSGK